MMTGNTILHILKWLRMDFKSPHHKKKMLVTMYGMDVN